MIAFPEMLVRPAKEAGIKVPENLKNYDNMEFVHWCVFCKMQLGAAMPSPITHWENAKVIANTPADRLVKMTAKQIIHLGFSVGYPVP